MHLILFLIGVLYLWIRVQLEKPDKLPPINNMELFKKDMKAGLNTKQLDALRRQGRYL